jgi:hypothetical protein
MSAVFFLSRSGAMANLNRIVLVDPSGGELFSGESVLSVPTSAVDDPTADRRPAEQKDEDEGEQDDEEKCPETLRSSVFVRIRDSVEPPIEVTEVTVDERKTTVSAA